MQYRALATFNYRAPDGSAKRAAKNSVINDLPPDAIEGLTDEGWIEPADLETMATQPPETQALTGAPETKALPDGWRDLNATDMKELARAISGETFGTKADAEEYLSDLEGAQRATEG